MNKMTELNVRLAKQLAAGRGLPMVVEVIEALVARVLQLESLTAGNDSDTRTEQYNAPATDHTVGVASPSIASLPDRPPGAPASARGETPLENAELPSHVPPRTT